MVRTLATLVSAAVLTTTGCAAFSDDGGSGSGEGRIEVVAAFYPLQFVAERVASDLADVEGLTSLGGEPHDLELTVRETAMLSSADVVVIERGFQPAVDASAEQNTDGAVVDAAEVVDLLPATDADHEAEGDHEGDHEGEDDHGDVDLHFWLDPERMADLGDAVAATLGEVDPDRADAYRANADALREDLLTLDEEMAERLGSCDRTTIVVSHDAFGYLGKYGLEVAPVAGLSPDAEPTPVVLGELQQLIERDGITTVFSERLASPELTDSLASDAGVTTAVLDPIEGLTEETAEQDYLSLMRENLERLVEANGCR